MYLWNDHIKHRGTYCGLMVDPVMTIPTARQFEGKPLALDKEDAKLTRRMCLACNREFTGIVNSCPHDGTVLVPVNKDQFVGTKLADRYYIQSVIGHGGMGVVYKARHELMDRIVAIKMLQKQLISDTLSVKRFQQEAKAACLLKHPNVITLFDFGVTPTGQPYLVMDYLEGVTLDDIIKQDGHVGVDRCIRIFDQACAALDHAHAKGVIHRDLKPGNIMLLDQDGTKDFVKVVDFGVAKVLGDDQQKLTQTGEVCGSPVYMSPEQCTGQKLDRRSDIYSFGVVLYEALTGQLPLLGKNMVETMSMHLNEMPDPFKEVRPDLFIPERLEAVVFKSLAKSPDDRHQSMAELQQDLQFAVPKPGQNIALRTQTTEIKSKPEEKSTTPVLIIALAALVIALGGAVTWLGFQKMLPWQSQEAVKPPPVSRPAPEASSPAAAENQSADTEKTVSEAKAPETDKAEQANYDAHSQDQEILKRLQELEKKLEQEKVSKPTAAPPRRTARPRTSPRPKPKPAGDPFAELRKSRSY